jgi:hypothetical protein
MGQQRRERARVKTPPEALKLAEVHQGAEKGGAVEGVDVGEAVEDLRSGAKKKGGGGRSEEVVVASGVRGPLLSFLDVESGFSQRARVFFFACAVFRTLAPPVHPLTSTPKSR